LQPFLQTSRVEISTIQVLLNQRRTTCLVSKVMTSTLSEVEAAEEEEAPRVEPEGVAEASRICKSMNLNSPLYEEAKVKSTFDKRVKARRDLQK
jgi:hypothetical protein